MQLNEAVELIKHETNSQSEKQIWVDLGAGSGIFTLALANFLPQESIIYAIDKNASALDKIPNQYKNIKIEKLHENFTKFELPQNLDGILMGNSLHFVKDKSSFIKRSKNYLKQSGSFLIVEYDSNFPSPWVPFPVSFKSLIKLFEKEGFTSIHKLKERQSIYRKAKIYSALIRK